MAARSAICVVLGIVACSVDDRSVDVGGGGTGSDASPSDAGAGGDNGGGAAGTGGMGGAAAGGEGGNTGGTDTLTPEGGPPDPPLPACAQTYVRELGSVQAATTSAAGDFTLSCSTGAADDVSFYWIAPSAGYYQIDTVGSSFDTSLAIVSPACDGTELACNDEGDVAPQSVLVRHFTAGEDAVVVVDGKSGGFGDVVLNVNAVTCPGIDLETQSLPLTSSTLDGTDVHTGSCGGAGVREKSFRWRAPSSGLYRFEVTSSDFAPALYVERGPRCGGTLLGCSQGTPAPFVGPAAVVRRLAEGEIVTLIVDSNAGEGSFELNVTDVSASACPSGAELDYLNETTATLSPDDPSLLTGSCAPVQQVIIPTGTFPLPEHVYPLTTLGGAICFLSINTDGPLVVYVLEGRVCGGPELVCQEIETLNVEQDIEVELGVLQGGAYDYTVVVEMADPASDTAVTYTLALICAQV